METRGSQINRWMKCCSRLLVLLTMLGLLAGFSACKKPLDREKDEVINVQKEDAEMNAAIAKARETLPEFWGIFEKPERGETLFALKVAISDGVHTEHFWVNDLLRQDGKLQGTINNEPNLVSHVKFGQRIDIPQGDISDWTYTRDGKMHGNHTLRPLFKHMTDEDVAYYKKMLAEP